MTSIKTGGYFDTLNQLECSKLNYGYEVGQELEYFRFLHKYYDKLRQLVIDLDIARENEVDVENYINAKNERDFFRNLVTNKIYGVTWINMWRLWLGDPSITQDEVDQITKGILLCRKRVHYSKHKIINQVLKEFKLLDGNRFTNI